MITVIEHEKGFLYSCECGRRLIRSTNAPWGHSCAGKLVTYWPEGFVAEKRRKRQAVLVKPSIPRMKLTDEQRAAGAEERKRLAAERKAQLGEKIETFLTSWGVTTEWWVSFKESHGLPPSCGCAARKEWFNKLGESLPWAAGIGVKLLEYLTRKTTADNAL